MTGRHRRSDNLHSAGAVPAIEREYVMRPNELKAFHRRRDVRQLARNEFPDCSVVFVTAPTGAIAFRISASSGRYRSGVIKLLAHHAHVRLNRAWLARQMKVHGGPAAA